MRPPRAVTTERDLLPDVTEEQVRKALWGSYAPDLCRGVDAVRVARLILRAHWDIQRCWCPPCVVARALVEKQEGCDE